MKNNRLYFPDYINYEIDLDVRITDINYGQHLGHDRLISLLHQARIKFLLAHNITEIDVGGCGLILTKLEIEYIREILLDETLTIQMAFGGIKGYSFLSYYKIVKKNTQKLCSLCLQKFVGFNYTQKTKQKLPKKFIEILENSKKSL